MAKPSIVGARTLSCKLKTLSRQMTACAGHLLEPFDVSPIQASILYEIAAGETSPSRIAMSTGVDASALSRQIRLLEERGLIERHVDDDNRTRALLALTAAGRRLAREIDPHAEQVDEILASALSRDELKALDRTLEKLSAALGARPAR